MLQGLRKYIGDKAFYKQAAFIIVPIVIQQLLLSSASYIDNLMVNSYGDVGAQGTSLAYIGVGAAGRLVFILSFVFMALSAAGSIFISQYFGAKNKEKIFESIRLSIYVAAIFGVLAIVAMHFFGKYVVDALIDDPVARACGYEYINMMKWGCLVFALNFAFATTFRSVKKPNQALMACIAGIAVNISLNYCLIFGNLGFPEMGVAGAALATVISKVVELVMMVALMLPDKFFKGLFAKLGVNSNLISGYVKKGCPLVMNELLWVFAMMLYLMFYTYNNDLWYNAYSYAGNISDLFFIIFAGLSNGTAIVVGAHLGASNFSEAKNSAERMKGLAVASGLFMGVLLAVTAPLFAGIFTNRAGIDPQIHDITVDILRVTALFITVYAYNATCFFILRSGGDSLRAFVLDQAPSYLVGIPISIVLGINAANWGLSIVFIFFVSHVSDLVKTILSVVFVKKGKWIVNLTNVDFSKKTEGETA